MPPRVLAICILCALYTAALIQLLWQACAALPVTCWPAQLLLWLHLIFHIARLCLDGAGATPQRHWRLSVFSLGYSGVDSVRYRLTFTLMAMVNERTQIAHQQASLRDPLTRAWNPHALFSQADKLVARCLRRRRPWAVLFDLDPFKSINDRVGHLQGDQVLQDFCAVIMPWLPPHGLFARLGG